MDLLRIYAAHYITTGEIIAYISMYFRQVEGKGHDGHPFPADARERLRGELSRLKKECDIMNLHVSSGLLAKAISDLPQTHREWEMIINVIKQELDVEMFLYIPSYRAFYYDWHQANSEVLVNNFPTASKEIIRASKCFAKNEDTACVFHSMRAAEIALRALTQHLNVTFPFPIDLADWHNLITNIESVIRKAEQQPRSASKDVELKFCSAAASQFRYFKEAYRKHVAHARENYSEEEALSIMERTGEFITGLAARISEL